MESLTGTVIASKYRVLRPLGKGGFGEVYLVEIVDGMVGQQLAMKLLPAELSGDPLARDRFFNEIRLAMKVVDRFIVQVRDVGSAEDGRLYYTMDHCPGVTLARLLERKGRLSSAETQWVARRLLRAAIAAHEASVVHRDLKPANVMVFELDGKKTLRVVDFGIAAAIGAARAESGRLIGTPAYMAPEQLLGGTVGFAADVYSIGAVLYTCLTARPPYAGASFEEVWEATKAGPPPRPDALVPATEPWLADAVLKALERRPEDRFGSAGAFLAAIDAGARAERDAGAPASAGPAGDGEPELDPDVTLEGRAPTPSGAVRRPAPPAPRDASAPPAATTAMRGRLRSRRRSRARAGKQTERVALVAVAVAVLAFGAIFNRPIRRMLGLLEEEEPARVSQARPATTAPRAGGAPEERRDAVGESVPAPVVEGTPPAIGAPSRPAPAIESGPAAPVAPGVSSGSGGDAPATVAGVEVDPPEREPEEEGTDAAPAEPPAAEDEPPREPVAVEPEPDRDPAGGERGDPRASTGAPEAAAGEEDPLAGLTGDRLAEFGRHAAALAAMATAGASESGLEVAATVLPDGYRWAMARDLGELSRTGYTGTQLVNELRKLHAEHRGLRRKSLIVVTLKATGPGTYFLEKGVRFIDIKKRSRVTFASHPESDSPSFELWEVFEYPPNRPRIYRRRALARLESLDLRLVSGNLDPDSKDPFTITVGNIVRQSKSGDPNNSINLRQRQLSCAYWKDLAVLPITLEFYPGSWTAPSPPEGFDAVLEALEQGR